MNSDDAARRSHLSDALRALVPALEAHMQGNPSQRTAARSSWQPRLDQPLPVDGEGADAVLDDLAALIRDHGLPLGAPGFCGWVTTAPTVVPAASAFAASIGAAQRWWVQPGNFIEILAQRWLGELLGVPDHAGAFTSGGSVANLLGLGAARQHAGERLGVDLAAEGLAALPHPRIYASDQVHHVVLRAAGTLGLGRRCVRRVPTDRKRRVSLDTLEQWLDEDIAAGHTPIAVVASAGDVNTGTIDPIDRMRDIAHNRDTWLHVDGAYGAFGVLDERVREQFGDLSKADSLVADPHKWLAVPVGCGAVFVRDGALFDRAFALEPAHYVAHERRANQDPASCFDELGEGSPDRGLDHSAPSRGIAVWAALREIGTAGMRARVTRHLDCARRVADRVRASDSLELLSEPVLSICCFRYHPPDIRDQGTLERLNRSLLLAVRARGRSMPSSTRVDNKLAFRPCFIGPNTTVADADALIDEVLAAAAEL